MWRLLKIFGKIFAKNIDDFNGARVLAFAKGIIKTPPFRKKATSGRFPSKTLFANAGILPRSAIPYQ
ncbi:hypothetical protein GXY_14532 [Novacetimonas hansenii ATCC 23769]|uniref:Uncharacterized protein n=1 Tax=Novacetimonas hansenii ATCC 23769 TaxID=714995 RepID=D5QIC5_NOVHA|nr:hypothetical protein GXY_14532 [Novacetimonas hansenii ATCC 23769]